MNWLLTAALLALVALSIYCLAAIGPDWWKYALLALCVPVGVAAFITAALWPIRNVEGPK